MALPVKGAYIAARKKMFLLLLPLMQLAYALNEVGLTDEEIAGIADDPELLATIAKTVRDVVHGVPTHLAVRRSIARPSGSNVA